MSLGGSSRFTLTAMILLREASCFEILPVVAVLGALTLNLTDFVSMH